jgi:hypothetical protein
MGNTQLPDFSSVCFAKANNVTAPLLRPLLIDLYAFYYLAKSFVFDQPQYNDHALTFPSVDGSEPLPSSALSSVINKFSVIDV